MVLQHFYRVFYNIAHAFQYTWAVEYLVELADGFRKKAEEHIVFNI